MINSIKFEIEFEFSEERYDINSITPEMAKAIEQHVNHNFQQIDEAVNDAYVEAIEELYPEIVMGDPKDDHTGMYDHVTPPPSDQYESNPNYVEPKDSVYSQFADLYIVPDDLATDELFKDVSLPPEAFVPNGAAIEQANLDHFFNRPAPGSTPSLLKMVSDQVRKDHILGYAQSLAEEELSDSDRQTLDKDFTHRIYKQIDEEDAANSSQ